MDKLGPFIMYQDPETSSAAVYYHKRNQFDGTIGISYILQGFSINHNQKNKVCYTENSGLYVRQVRDHSPKSLQVQPRIFPKQFFRWLGGQFLNPDDFHVSLSHHPNNNYIEILIVVNYDLAEELLEPQGNEYTKLVSYFITLFNSVDMLISKIDTPKIKVNIAGIIIAPERVAIPLISFCYKENLFKGTVVEEIDGSCVNRIITSYMSMNEHKIPLDSYDITIFVTKYKLFMNNYNDESGKQKIYHIAGLTLYPNVGIYKCKSKKDPIHASISIKIDKEYLNSFPVIAHEIVHSIGVADHDKPDLKNNEICGNSLMKMQSGFCDHCLTWSHETKNFLMEIFKTSDSCLFKNKPRSLNPPGPQKMLTANEQCQCYGYNKSTRTLQNIFSYIFFRNYCTTPLQCENNYGTIDNTIIPMDGTPCNQNKNSIERVCWSGKCQKIEIVNYETQCQSV